MISLKDKVKGLFWFLFGGDALGMPVETYTPEQIQQIFGRITKYLKPLASHKWYSNFEAGQWTDDTQLTLAIAESLSFFNGAINLQDIADRHVLAKKESIIGWGKATKNSVERIEQGISYHSSGDPNSAGNGVAMKVAPISAMIAKHYQKEFGNEVSNKNITELMKSYNYRICQIAWMTHNNRLAAASGLAQVVAILYCLLHTPETFKEHEFLDLVIKACKLVESQKINDTLTDNLSTRFQILKNSRCSSQSLNTFRELFGNTCYVYESLPFTHAGFLRDPSSIEVMYDLASAGGDTDTNCAMWGALYGALNGIQKFPLHLKEGLYQKERLEEAVNSFIEKLDIN